MKSIINCKLVLENEIIDKAYIEFDEKIVSFGQMKDIKENKNIDEVIDAKGKFVTAGFVDVHIHGAGGSDAMDDNSQALDVIASSVYKNGVTSFLATTMTMSKEDIVNSLDKINKYMEIQGDILDKEQVGQADKSYNKAKIAGVHLEGPFISGEKKGAQNGDYIVDPNYDLIVDYLDIIRLITVAPERDLDFRFINKMKEYPNVTLSIGHSNSDFEMAVKAFENGVTHVTHCFNGMNGLHHRKPGIIGSVMSHQYTVELIADEIHVHKGLFQGMVNLAGKKNLVLITDSMRAGGLGEGEYDLGGQQVIVKEGECRLCDGTLAGSILTMDKALLNFKNSTDLTINELINLVTINPARAVKLDDTIGSIEIGKCSDFNIVNDDMTVEKTIVSGRL